MKTRRRVVEVGEFAIGPEEPAYVIGVVSRLVGLPVWTLRILDREGVVRPRARAGRARLYSMIEVRRLVRVRYWMVDRHVNVEGVRALLELEQTS